VRTPRNKLAKLASKLDSNTGQHHWPPPLASTTKKSKTKLKSRHSAHKTSKQLHTAEQSNTTRTTKKRAQSASKKSTSWHSEQNQPNLELKFRRRPKMRTQKRIT
jgi:hypothetical protein